MKYTAEEVRARFEAAFGKCPEAQLTRNGDGYLFIATDHRWDGWQAAYAERIEADESAVLNVVEQVLHESRKVAHLYHSGDGMLWYFDQELKKAFAAPSTEKSKKLFTHPPAQAAQVDPAAKLRTLADFVNAPDAERARTGQQVAARVDEMMAEPVAQGEVDELISAYDDAVRSERESGFLPPLAQKAARDCVSHNRNRLRKYLAAQTRAVPDGDDALCKLAEKYGDEGGRPA